VRKILAKHKAILAMLLAALACLAVGSASASTMSTSFKVPLPSDVPVPPDSTNDTLVLSTSLALLAGESRRVSDRLGATLSSSEGAEVDNRILCLDPSGMAVAEAASGTNHPGSGAGEIGLMESLLLTAPVAGTYTCQILGRTSDDDRTNFVMTALRGGPQFGTNGTWLQISSADEVGSHAWYNYDCNSTGTSPTCVYLGGSGTPRGAHVFNGPDRDVWTAATDTTQVDVVGTFQITSCPHGTASCISRHWGDNGWLGLGINKDRSAELQSYIEFDQLNPDGTVCRIHQSNDDTSPTSDSAGPGVYYIKNSVHHLPVKYHLTANVSPNCNGSRRFALDLYVGWWAGNPIKLDNGSFNVIQSIRGATTTTVPDVVGMTEAQAANAIKARALKPVTLQPVMNPAPIGTVFAQNSQGGTGEPTDSEVDLSVSLGQTTVPSVVGDKTASAVSAITAAGLTVQISSVNNCVDPGFVQLQNPRGGTQVIPGTPVHITTATCSSGGGSGPGGGNGPPIQPK